MTRRVTLIVDCDDVLNDDHWVNHHSQHAKYPRASYEWFREMLDPERVRRLQRIVETTGCEVIVASNWREALSIDQLTSLLGVNVRGVVPLNLTDGKKFSEYPSRGAYIVEWLVAERFQGVLAILDDDYTTPYPRTRRHTKAGQLTEAYLSARWVPIHEGLGDAEAEKAIALLAEQPTPVPLDAMRATMRH